MNLEGKWSLTTPLTSLSWACSYYEIFRRCSRLFQIKKLTGQSIFKTDHHCTLFNSYWLQLFFDLPGFPRDQFELTRDPREQFFDPKTLQQMTYF